MREIIIIAHDMRSTHNVGSLFRTAEGLGVKKLYLTGYTPYPAKDNDSRLPHISAKLDQQIQKTSLDAHLSIDWDQNDDINQVIDRIKQEGFKLIALEQTDSAIELPKLDSPDKVAIILGTEVTGIPEEILELTDMQVIIPMYGKKESFNVVQAAAMALYQLRFY